MSTVAFDVEAVRRRFSALARPLVLLDAPGGTQVPDSVVDAMATYLRESNANLGGPFETSRRSDLVVAQARMAAAALLGCSPEEVCFGPNMTTLNFALTRAFGRELVAGDEIVVTRLDHDGNIAPWLELAHDRDLVVRMADFDDECRLDLADLETKLSGRTRVVAFPLASNAVGTVTEARRIADLAHAAGALAWVDAVHYAPHGPIDVDALGADVLLCSPYKFFGPHLGLLFGRRDVLERLSPYKVRPAPDEPVGSRFETGTQSHEALAGFVACVEYLRSVAGTRSLRTSASSRAGSSTAYPRGTACTGRQGWKGGSPRSRSTHPKLSPDEVAGRLAEHGIAVWPGNYYAVEAMTHLGLPEGAVRVGLIHYNTPAEVDRVLEELEALL